MEQECRAQDSAVSSSGLTVLGEVLGSVTHHTDSEGGPGIQLRTSARVSKKLKLDSLAHAHSSSDKKGKWTLLNFGFTLHGFNYIGLHCFFNKKEPRLVK